MFVDFLKHFRSSSGKEREVSETLFNRASQNCSEETKEGHVLDESITPSRSKEDSKAETGF